MRLASPFIGIFTIILLVAIPVGGSPALQVGSHATYNLKATFTFPPPICETEPASGMSSIVMCPMSSMIAFIPPDINVTGTFGWSATGLNSSSVTLNVRHNVTISSDGLMIPSVHRTGSFNETVNLATRIISILPVLKSEMDDALQLDQSMMSASSTAGLDPSVAMNTIESTTFQPHPVYTMWWINNASSLKLNQTVPVLFFPTNVTGSTNVDLGSLGTRQAWTLTFSPKLFTMPDASSISSASTSSSFGVAFTFNYDKKSGVLLSAAVDINFNEEIIQPTECSTSSNPPIAWCNNGSMVLSRSCGFNLNATLTLAGTSLNLDQSMNSGGPSEGDTAAGSGGSSSTGGNGSGSGTGSGSGPSQGSGSGSGSGTGPGSGSGSNAGNTPSPTSAKPGMATAPWIYLLLGLVIVAIIATGLWIARRRSKKSTAPATQ